MLRLVETSSKGHFTAEVERSRNMTHALLQRSKKEDNLIEVSLKSWENKASLRYVYIELFQRVREFLLPGSVLEVAPRGMEKRVKL